MSEQSISVVGAEPITDVAQLPAPTLQPNTGLAGAQPVFSSTEILWWNNGVWGACGYAIPNPHGKVATKNPIIAGIVEFIGRELFALLHAVDVKFPRPFNLYWLRSVSKMLKLGRKRMQDRTVGWTDKRTGDGERATNVVRQFMLYPVPFFGGRVQQADAVIYGEIVLTLLSEVMQHPDNDLDGDVTDFLASRVDQQLQRIEREIGAKYLGLPRATVEAADFTLPDITEANYKPDELFTTEEMNSERPPVLWWPTANDLTPIRGIPAATAMAYAMRWPNTGLAFMGDSGAVETAFPGLVVGKTTMPGDVSTGGSVSADAGGSIATPGSV